MFAADSEQDLHHWIGGFRSGATIQVQPVKTVEEIRITDLEMQKRWTAMDKIAAAPPASEVYSNFIYIVFTRYAQLFCV